MDVRFASSELESTADGSGIAEHLPEEVVNEVQKIVYWMKKSDHAEDRFVFLCSADEGGKESFDLQGGYRLHYVIEADVIRFIDLLCK